MLAFALSLLVVGGLETDPEFKSGTSQIEAFEYEKAAATFDKVSKRAALPDADRALALVWLGLACAELRDQARASVAFEDAVTADPLIVLPRDASPKIKALLEDARARVRLRPKATAPTGVAPTGTTPTGTTNTPPATTAATGTTPVASAAQPAEASSGFVPVAVGTLIVGGVVAVAGGAVWGAGLFLRGQAINAPFQSDAETLREQSLATQVIGQVATGVGVAALAVGGGLFAVGEMDAPAPSSSSSPPAGASAQ